MCYIDEKDCAAHVVTHHLTVIDTFVKILFKQVWTFGCFCGTENVNISVYLFIQDAFLTAPS